MLVKVENRSGIKLPKKTEETIQQDDTGDATKLLVSRMRDKNHSSTPARNLPLRFAFPHFGPSIFMKSELTSENQTPVVELDFQHEKKRGER